MRWPCINAPPASSGFGTRLDNKTIVRELGGTIIYDWQPEGLVLTITTPIVRLQDQSCDMDCLMDTSGR
jgi:two-component sensor histidine kinase